MRNYDIPKECPVCGSAYFIKTLECNGCHTALDGKFSIGPFANLNQEQITFVMTFIKCSGNIQKVGKELSMSYPTVKNRLGKVQVALGYNAPNEDILTMLKNDEITLEEATNAILKDKKA